MNNVFLSLPGIVLGRAYAASKIGLGKPGRIWTNEPLCLRDTRMCVSERETPDILTLWRLRDRCQQCPALPECRKEYAPDGQVSWDAGWLVIAGHVNPRYS